MNTRKYHIDHTRFQGMRFCSHLTGGQAVGSFLICLLQTVFTLGLGMPWAVVRWKKCLLESVSTHGSVDVTQLRGEYDRYGMRRVIPEFCLNSEKDFRIFNIRLLTIMLSI